MDGAAKRVRLLGIDAPERATRAHAGAYCAETAAQRVADWMPVGSEIWMAFDKERQDRYGRLLAYVWGEKRFLNGALLAGGLARRLPIGENRRYDEALDEAALWGRQVSTELVDSNGRAFFSKQPTISPKDAEREEWCGREVLLEGTVGKITQRRPGGPVHFTFLDASDEGSQRLALRFEEAYFARCACTVEELERGLLGRRLRVVGRLVAGWARATLVVRHPEQLAHER